MILIGRLPRHGRPDRALPGGDLPIADTDLIVSVDYTGWGLIHLGHRRGHDDGAGYGLFYRKTWARIVTIVVALISAVINFAFLPAYPVWYTLMIGLDVLIIWAVTAHADDGNRRWPEVHGGNPATVTRRG